MTAVASVDQRGDEEYAHLLPLLDAYSAMRPGDSCREQSRERLIAGFLPVAQHIAQRYAHRGEPVEDLTQVATIGLINAIDRYRPGQGHHFLGYAIPTMTGEVRRYFRDRGWAIRVPRRLKDNGQLINGVTVELSHQLGRAPKPSEIADALNLSTDDVLEAIEAARSYRATSLDELLTDDTDSDSLVNLLGKSDTELEKVTYTHSLAPLLAELTPRERNILIMRFFHDMTQSQIAANIGCSQMHISRILAHTLSHLRDRMNQD
ncbi:SigB/SigF/SigG family RNA polymerase sigma factor [Pseudonocardia spinosispora]|uniref:SigB/SigF/SigG family RNA polymerase sigma factor n=1 Tax=Pseudonocardia spinosispora TaxID=103441 RepID=UPI000416C9E8|nr:SigB/SigF/SigG family RNA polymerase sigma factor [Pseudonocardia spinosispora]